MGPHHDLVTTVKIRKPKLYGRITRSLVQRTVKKKRQTKEAMWTGLSLGEILLNTKDRKIMK